jgi:TPP-dependent pyruvate/acetoin dehydrogenase alpha subunit
MKDKLINENLINEVQDQEIITKIGSEINEAFVYAKESPFPESIEAYNGEYAI